MRLLRLEDDGGFSLTEYVGNNIPRYAILSHTWGTDEEEVTFKDVIESESISNSKEGYRKIQFCGKQAAKDGLEFFWVDTCCIDKSSSTELSEAINSMFRWYREAAKCYVYLADVSTAGFASKDSSFRRSRWFTRGWTLQELIATPSVEFFSIEEELLGDKASMMQELHNITGVPLQALQGRNLSTFTVDERILWAERRQTKREEDAAYSLMGIFDIHMPLIYGEGRARAFKRLRREISTTSSENEPSMPPAQDQTPRRTLHNIPFRRDPDFVARSALLHQLEEKLSAPASRIALVGLGGVGKSQLAIEHCYRTTERLPETWVFWIYAGNVSRLEQGFRDIAELIELPRREDPQADVFKLVHNWLREAQNGKWLLVVDNADDVAALSQHTSNDQKQPLSKYIPPSRHGAVLVTSRIKQEASRLVEDSDIIPIGPMHDTDAQALLHMKLSDKVNKDNVGELAAALDYMPLALVQAAAYIQKRAPRCSVRQYLENFHRSDRKKTRLLDYDAGHLRRDEEANNSILITWQISFDHVRSLRPSAANLLSLMSFFDRQGIPEALLRGFNDQGNNKGLITNGEKGEESDHGSDVSERSDNGFEDDIVTLQEYSFISLTTDEGMFEMHRLVQLATRKWLEGQGQLELWKQKYVANLHAGSPKACDGQWTQERGLYPHVLSALVQEPKGEKYLQKWVQLLDNAARYALYMGRPSEAEKIALKLMAASTELFGQDHAQTLSSMSLVGTAILHGGRWAEAQELLMLIVQTRKRVLGSEHHITQDSIESLALTYYSQGRWEQAQELLLQVVEVYQRFFGVEHFHTLRSTSILAMTYSKQQRWVESDELLLRVIETRQRILMEEDTYSLSSMNNLAFNYQGQGRWAMAEKLLVQVIEKQGGLIGVEHPDTLISMNNLAMTYSSQGQWTQAEELYKHVIDTQGRILGEEHPDTLNSMSNLAVVYIEEERWPMVKEKGVWLLETQKRVLGAKHPTTLIAMGNFAYALYRLDDIEEAVSLMEEVVEVCKQVFGDAHPTLVTYSLCLSAWQDEVQDRSESEHRSRSGNANGNESGNEDGNESGVEDGNESESGGIKL